MEDNLTARGIRRARINEEKIVSKIQRAHRKNFKRVNKFNKKNVRTDMDIENSRENDTGIVFARESGHVKSDKGFGFSIKKFEEEEEEKAMLFFELNEHNDDNLETEQIEQDKGIFNKALRQEITDWIKHILIAVIVGLLLVVFVVQRNEVVGSSMEPTLMNSDQLLVQKISKLLNSGIGHGDIITIDAKGLPYHNGDNNIIKRVIGLPGDTIEIKDGYVYRNGMRLEEKYLDNVDTSERKPEYSKVTLRGDEYYLLGDNRPVSLDSRTFGPVDKSRIVGEVLIRFYPLDHFGKP